LQIECPKLREKAHFRIGQMVMDPPRKLPPFSWLLVPIMEPWNYDTGGSTHAAITIPLIPDMGRIIRLIRRTVMTFFVPFLIHRLRAIGGSDRNSTEVILNRFQ
jgi:hypothetical protein